MMIKVGDHGHVQIERNILIPAPKPQPFEADSLVTGVRPTGGGNCWSSSVDQAGELLRAAIDSGDRPAGEAVAGFGEPAGPTERLQRGLPAECV